MESLSCLPRERLSSAVGLTRMDVVEIEILLLLLPPPFVPFPFPFPFPFFPFPLLILFVILSTLLSTPPAFPYSTPAIESGTSVLVRFGTLN